MGKACQSKFLDLGKSLSIPISGFGIKLINPNPWIWAKVYQSKYLDLILSYQSKSLDLGKAYQSITAVISFEY
jgi:hypothetical protein